MSAGRETGLRRALRMAALAGFGLLAVTLEAAPLGLSPAAVTSPDLVFCIVAHWALRVPGAAPVLLVFALGLARDLLTDLPVGLGALGLVFAAEWLKTRRALLARQPFVLEWLAVAAAAAAMAAALWLAVLLSLAQPPFAAALARHTAATILVYPLVTACLGWVLGIGSLRDLPRAAGEAR
ncbi:hypothetical protein LNKW23_33230 [Paralimibaculum aggregatum]|uniref:Rod shape-determining protein MreD n=1 Tax=Paralimibaculum aggregatum TaxID=3036245 RepID=A0ABQ6LLN1_9RHOB|nr:hypothetical protein [Limibaculum sp. NKW23]GMG84109.1 hypothetical protein LNKW23_33230 [Limibaculum sp. NKW23]